MIVDLHLDLLLDSALERVRGERDVFRRRHQRALRDGGVAVQVLPMYPDDELGGDPWQRIVAQLDAAAREEEESGGALRMVSTVAELRAALDEARGETVPVVIVARVEPHRLMLDSECWWDVGVAELSERAETRELAAEHARGRQLQRHYG